MYIAETTDVSKKYGNKNALDQISFTVVPGECFGILGHNGAGKTTLVETMIGLKKASAGQIKILGHNMSERKSELFEEIGVQLQQSSYQSKIKVQELCQERAVLYQKDIDFEVLLKKFSLADKAAQVVETLSGGEKQKLSILLAVMHDPKLIFLDELTTGLDAVARREIWKYLLDLKKSGKSIILTSHYMDEVEMLCDRILILKDGKRLADGSVLSVVDSSPYQTLDEAFIWYMGEEDLL